jgi:hypothetical protein
MKGLPIRVAVLCGLWAMADGRLTAQQAPAKPPAVGVVPGAPAGSPEQAPDTSNFDYSLAS